MSTVSLYIYRTIFRTMLDHGTITEYNKFFIKSRQTILKTTPSDYPSVLYSTTPVVLYLCKNSK